MKEFIDKLIERLLLESSGCRVYKLINPNIEDITEFNAYKKCIEIVNQLAEEYKHCTLCYLGSPCEYQNKNAMMPNELLADKNGWIPCSERLPEAGKRYLVSVVWKDEFNNYIRPAVYDAVYGKDGLWHTYDYEPVVYEVIAWQPLPAPYTEGE